MSRRLIIGCGNEFRGDDAAGIAVIRQLEGEPLPDTDLRECSGEGAALMDAWSGYDEVVIIDAASGGIAPGEVREWDACRQPTPSEWRSASTHSFGVADAIEVGRALNSLPPRLSIVAIGGKQFDAGFPLSNEVQQTVEALIRRLTSQP